MSNPPSLFGNAPAAQPQRPTQSPSSSGNAAQPQRSVQPLPSFPPLAQLPFTFSNVPPTLPSRQEQELNQAKEKLKKNETDISSYQAQLAKLEEEIKKYRTELDIEKDQTNELRKAVVDCQRDLDVVKEKYRQETRKVHDLEDVARLRGKNLTAVNVLLKESNILPFAEIPDKIEGFNTAISRVAKFLVNNTVYRPAEAFQDELDLALVDVQSTIGFRCSELLVSRSQTALTGVSKPNPFFLGIILQVFLAAFCVSEIEPRSMWTDRGPDISSSPEVESRAYHILQSTQTPLSFKDFKTALVQKLANIFKVASWTLPGISARTSFEALLGPLFEAKESLRTALSTTFRSANLEIAVADCRVAYNEEYMENFCSAGSDGGTDDGGEWPSPDLVVGTVGIGLKMAVQIQGSEEVRLKNVVRAQVILESTLESALTDETQMEYRSRDGQLEDGRHAP